MGATFLKLHWFWKWMIIAGTANVAYALVKRDCPPCDPGLQLNPVERVAGGLHRSGVLSRRGTAKMIRRGSAAFSCPDGYQWAWTKEKGDHCVPDTISTTGTGGHSPPRGPGRLSSRMPWPGA